MDAAAEATLAALHPLRAAPASIESVAADLAAGFALGLLLAWLAVLAARGLTARQATPAERAAARLDRLRGLAPPQRIAGQLAALEAAARASGIGGPDWLAAAGRRAGLDPAALGLGPGLRRALYAGGPLPDPDATEAAVRRLLARLGA